MQAQRSLRSTYTPEPVWQYQADSVVTTVPVFVNGSLIFTTYDNFSGGIMHSVDAQTTSTLWSSSFRGSDFSTLIAVNSVVYAGDQNGALYAIDSVKGGTIWKQTDYSITGNSLLSANGKLIFTTSDGYLRALDLQGNALWSFQPFRSGVSNPVISGGLVLVNSNDGSMIYAIDLNTGQQVWNFDLQYQMLGGLEVGQGSLYVLSSGGLLNALDIATGRLLWRWPAGGSTDLFLSCVYSNGAVYVGAQSGRFYAVDAASANTLWTTLVPDRIPGPIYVEDGIAYFAGPTGTLYAVDLASNGEDIVTYNAQYPPVIASIDTGVVYYYAVNRGLFVTNFGAVNLAGLIHEFFAESELMVEDYAKNATTGAPQGKSTSYRTHIRLLDPNKNPRVKKSVKVWASGPVSITSAGSTYAIDTAATGKAAWLQTDGLGELSIVSSASALSTPALYLWGNFMQLDEALVVYPDHDSLGKLSNVQGSDLQQAKGYDGSQMIPANYTKTDDLASTIRNTIGGMQPSLIKTQERNLANAAGLARGSRPAAAATTYFAYPASTTNMLYQPKAGPTDRAYVPGVIPQWTATFGGEGGVTFSAGVSLKPAERARLQEDGTPLPGSFLGTFDDFVNDVVNGAHTVSKIVFSTGQTIYDELLRAFEFVIDTVEKAIAVVTSILKTVVNDIEKAIQWLSYLFDWGDILAVKDELKSTALARFNNLSGWINGQINNDLTAVNGFFTNLENDVQSTFSQARNLLGSSSLQSKQQNGNDPQSLYGAGGAKSYTKSRWLMSKFTDNAAGGNVGSAAAAAPRGTDPILSVIDTLITDLEAAIAKDTRFQSIPNDLKNVFSNFGSLATSPSDFVTHSFNDLLNLISDICVSLLQFTESVAQTGLQALGQVVPAVAALVSEPISIPGVSDLYSLITNGSQLSVIDLCCLLVAVPATIVQKALNQSATGSLRDPARPSLLGEVVLTHNIGYLFAAALYAILDPLMDLTESPLPLKFGYLGLCIVLQGLNFPTDLAENTPGDYVFYAALAIPIVVTGVDIANTISGGEGSWELLSPTINIFYGIVMLATSVVLGMQNPRYQGRDYLQMVQNIFSFIPYIGKPLGLAGEDGRIALSVIDGCGDLTALGLATAQQAM